MTQFRASAHSVLCHARSKGLISLTMSLLALFWLIRIYPSYQNQFRPFHATRKQPTIGKVSMVYGNRTIYERALETHLRHSRKYGYPTTVLRRPMVDGLWNKNAIIMLSLLRELEKPPESRLKWLFWFDADTVLLNPNIPLEAFLPPPHLDNVHLLVTKDWNGLNNGVFFYRVHPWSLDLFSAATSFRVINSDVELVFSDQSALGNLLDNHTYFSKSAVYCPPKWFNAYNTDNTGIPKEFQTEEGRLLVHVPGTPKKMLEEVMQPYIDIANSHEPAWEVPFEDTPIKQETQIFWKTVRS